MNKISQININNYYQTPKKYSFGKNYHAKNPIVKFEARKNEVNIESLKAHSLAFLGKPKEVVTPKTLYKKIYEQSLNLTDKEIEIIFKNIKDKLSKEGIVAKDEDILLTMWTLTQYANLDGIKELNEKIKQEADGCYRARKKEIPIGLGNTLRYLSSKNIARMEVRDKTIFPLDEMGMGYIERMLSEEGKTIDLSEYEFIYPIGWNEGINLFNQEKSYDKFIESVCNVVKKSYEKNKNFEKDLKITLTEDIAKRAADAGIRNLKIFSTRDDEKRIELKDIKNNLNSKIPTEDEINAICGSLGKYLHKENGKSEEYWTNLIAKYLYDGLTIYTPKQLSEKMKVHYRNIEKALPKGKTMKDVYYLIPELGRSFSYINYQYAIVNNIPMERFIAGDTDKTEYEYEGEIFGYIDDISASGQTTLEELGGLNYKGLYHISEDDKRRFQLTTNEIQNQYIIATIFTTRNAKNVTEEEINRRERINPLGEKIKDKLVITDFETSGIDVKYSKEEEEDMAIVRKLFTDFNHGDGGFQGLETKVIFPYMTPDSNTPILRFISEKMVERNAIKTQLEPAERAFEINEMIKKELAWNNFHAFCYFLSNK